jgi:trans-aconitate 2-methyltransferase
VAESVPPEWDAAAYKRINNLQEWLAGRALTGLDLRGNERVLDVGCGDGRVSAQVLARLPQGSLTGVDPSLSMVEAASARLSASGRATIAVGTAATMTYRDEFDVVVSFNALHWELRWRDALNRIRAALRAAGSALLVFVCDGERPSLEDVMMQTAAASPWAAAFGDFSAPYVHVDPAAYTAAAQEAGFVVDSVNVDDLTWDFGSAKDFASWCSAGSVAWTSRLPEEKRSGFVDEALAAYAKVSGSPSTFRFLQCRVSLRAVPFSELSASQPARAG